LSALRHEFGVGVEIAALRALGCLRRFGGEHALPMSAKVVSEPKTAFPEPTTLRPFACQNNVWTDQENMVIRAGAEFYDASFKA
jgi:hypothetical protein